MSGLPTGTVTLLFTDIERSTQLARRLGDRYGEVLENHRLVLRDAYASHGGVEIDTQGDASFAAFGRAHDAVAAAADAQRGLAGAELAIRVGVHTGEPSLADGGYYVGVDLSRAARICAAAHGGQVLLSRATYDLVDSDFEIRDLGEHLLKDIDAPERLLQLRCTGPPRSLSTAACRGARQPAAHTHAFLRTRAGARGDSAPARRRRAGRHAHRPRGRR